eukprot:12592933-Heterocapsa_arctica.AAC.1
MKAKVSALARASTQTISHLRAPLRHHEDQRGGPVGRRKGEGFERAQLEAQIATEATYVHNYAHIKTQTHFTAPPTIQVQE